MDTLKTIILLAVVVTYIVNADKLTNEARTAVGATLGVIFLLYILGIFN
jgi:ABC-type transport system involved in cytochrome c biogenesis permease subunit